MTITRRVRKAAAQSQSYEGQEEPGRHPESHEPRGSEARQVDRDGRAKATQTPAGWPIHARL